MDKQLEREMKEVGMSDEGFYKYLNISFLADMPTNVFPIALNLLDAKRRAKK